MIVARRVPGCNATGGNHLRSDLEPDLLNVLYLDQDHGAIIYVARLKEDNITEFTLLGFRCTSILRESCLHYQICSLSTLRAHVACRSIDTTGLLINFHVGGWRGLKSRL